MSCAYFLKNHNAIYSSSEAIISGVENKLLKADYQSIGGKQILIQPSWFSYNEVKIRQLLGDDLLKPLLNRFSLYLLDSIKNPFLACKANHSQECLEYKLFSKFIIRNTQNLLTPRLYIKINNVWHNLEKHAEHMGFNAGIFTYTSKDDLCGLQMMIIKMVAVDFCLNHMPKLALNGLLSRFLSHQAIISELINMRPEIKHYLRCAAKTFNRVLGRLTHSTIKQVLTCDKHDSLFVSPISLSHFLGINTFASNYPEKVNYLLNGNRNVCQFGLKSKHSSMFDSTHFSLKKLNCISHCVPDKRSLLFLLNCQKTIFSIITNDLVEQSHTHYIDIVGEPIKESYLYLLWLSNSKFNRFNPYIVVRVLAQLHKFFYRIDKQGADDMKYPITFLGDILYQSLLTPSNSNTSASFEEIIDFAIHAENDTQIYNGFTHLVHFHSKCTLKSISSKIKTWHKKLYETKISETDFRLYPKICIDRRINGFEFKPIESNLSLLSETQKMKHCVYSYDEKISDGSYSVITVFNSVNQVSATLGVFVFKNNGCINISFQQCFGVLNSTVPVETMIACNEYIKQENCRLALQNKAL